MTSALDIVASNAPFNLARHCLQAHANATPDKPALEVFANLSDAIPSEVWTYASLEDAVLRVAGGLSALGFQPATRLLIRLDNTSTYPIVYLGAMAAGLIAIPTSSQLTPSEASFLLSDSGAEVVAVSRSLADQDVPANVRVLNENDIRQMMRDGPRGAYAATRANDPAYLVYTSGTTARPKGVVHAHRVVLGRQPMYHGWYAITPNDRVLHAGAFNWTYTLGTGLIDPWSHGATSLIYTGEKSPELWPQLIRKTGATLFAAVPSLFRQILKYATPGAIDVGRLRHGLIAGERPPEDLFETWYARTGTHLHEALGMSEISTYISTSPTIPRKPGTTGRAQAGRRVALLPVEVGTDPLPSGEEGLIAVHRSDPGLMLGYWQRPEEDAEVTRGDWFIGGDIGVMDADGYITHLGRANDVIKALGYRVSPQEIEAVLAQCPGVGEVACAEVQVRSDVSVVGAFVIRAPGSSVRADNIAAFAAERLAAYKCPREIVFVDHFPRTANGKIKRNALVSARETTPTS
jgi:acetyl-CoA synthetase